MKFALLLVAAMANLQGCVPLVIGAAAGTGIILTEDRRSDGTILDDQAIEIQAGNRIQHRFGDQARVAVTSFNRFVLLTGTVPSEAITAEVASVVLEVPNVRNIQNELGVSGTPSFMSRSNDALLSTRVKGRLVQSKNVDGSYVKVVADNGSVYLMGLVTRAEAEEAAHITATTAGVERVVKVFEYVD
ncbi:MAG TPA: BON domain-containing protein [Burkholderiales bacterium]|nr:BON domain-containing protein [Burkholderiales bacterium]